MNDNNIDQFREEIRKRLRETKNETSDSVIANHSKFNEELEFHLENIKEDIPSSIYDLLLQTGNLAYMKGIHAGLAAGNEKAANLARIVAGLKNRVDVKYSESTTSEDLKEINKSITALVGVILFGFLALILVLIAR